MGPYGSFLVLMRLYASLWVGLSGPYRFFCVLASSYGLL